MLWSVMNLHWLQGSVLRNEHQGGRSNTENYDLYQCTVVHCTIQYQSVVSWAWMEVVGSSLPGENKTYQPPSPQLSVCIKTGKLETKSGQWRTFCFSFCWYRLPGFTALTRTHRITPQCQRLHLLHFICVHLVLLTEKKEITGKLGLSKLPHLSESGVKVWTISDVWWSGKFNKPLAVISWWLCLFSLTSFYSM